MDRPEHILSIRNELGEGPLWHVAEQSLYWVDITGHCFYRMNPDAPETLERFDVGLPLGALGFRPGGGLVLATRDGFATWDAASQSVSFIADPESGKSRSRFNDGKVDRNGRFWAGTMGDGENSALYRLDPDGSVHTMVNNVGTSNGIGWSPDDRIMYYTDSPRHAIYAYDYDAATGSINNRRILVHDPDQPGVPDGLTVDEEGFIWSARWGGWCLNRFDPEGKMERRIEMPVEFPTSCIFGGPDLDELYITSAWIQLGKERKDEQPLSGDIFRLKTAVKGLPEPMFAG